MTTNRKFTNDAPVVKQAEAVETVTTLYTKSVEQLAEAQKKTLDLALQQNAEIFGTWKNFAQGTPGTPVPAVLDLAAHTFGQFVELQKSAIDLAVEQSQALSELTNDRVGSVSQTTEALASVAQDGIERAVATQKYALESYATQTRTVLDTFKRLTGVAGTPAEAAAESIQRGFDSLVETQKGILNIASKRQEAHKATA